MKRIFCLLCIILSIFTTLSFGVNAVNADEYKVYLGGIPAGFSIYTKGAHIVGLCDVITNEGIKSPSKDADIRVGDIILKISNIDVNNAKDIENTVLNECKTDILIERNGETINKNLTPAKDLNGKFKLGVFIKDSVSGIGTITYIDNNHFASLGHAVIDDNGETMKILGGQLYDCNITGIVKGEKGKAGELKGVFLRKNSIASIDKNLVCGVYGDITKDFNTEKLEQISIGEAAMGDAFVYTTIDGCKPEKYSISIVKSENYSANKNFVVEIKDKLLLEKTGGIVQGMSGSPIVQNGKLVGAITHVFVNDPTRGFGISIYNMIKN